MSDNAKKMLKTFTVSLLATFTLGIQAQAGNLSDSKTIAVSIPVDQMIRINGLTENVIFNQDSNNDGNYLSEDLSFTVGRRGAQSLEYFYTVLLSAEGGYEGDYFRLNNTTGGFLRMQVSYFDENPAGSSATPETPIFNQVTSQSLDSVVPNARLRLSIPLEDIDDAGAGTYGTDLNFLVSVQ